MASTIVAQTLRHLMQERSTHALLDVREHGEYNAAHIPGASSLPRRLIEFRLAHAVPCRKVQVIVCDDNGPRARNAARTIEGLGYERVAVLEGGVNYWANLDYPIEWGMNVPGKRFGEQVQACEHVPSIDASELNRDICAGRPALILDVRTPDEYTKTCIPGALCIPGGELVLQVPTLLEQHPYSKIVVHCAGRPRSILATQLLRRMGIPNVFGLRNGTSGWTLAGFHVETGATRVVSSPPSADAQAAAASFAVRIAGEDGVQFLPVEQLDDIAGETACTYRLDVRTAAEFRAGHIPGFSSFPGGQTVLHSDDMVAVRNSTIVFCCDGIARSTVVASWFRQMGFVRVYAVKGGTTAWQRTGLPLEAGDADPAATLVDAAMAKCRAVSPAGASTLVATDQPAVLFVDTSKEFAAGHIAGSRWLLRSWLDLDASIAAGDKRAPILITDTDGRNAALAAVALTELGYECVFVLEGGLKAWTAAGLPVEQGLSGVLVPPQDVVPTGGDRPCHEMINYLRWEETLGHAVHPQQTSV